MTAAQKWKALERWLVNRRLGWKDDGTVGCKVKCHQIELSHVQAEMSRLSRPTRTGRKRP